MKKEVVTVTYPLTLEEKAEDADKLKFMRQKLSEQVAIATEAKEQIKGINGLIETVLVELDKGKRDHELLLSPRKNFTYNPPRKEWVDDSGNVVKSRELRDDELQTNTEDWIVTEEGEEKKPKEETPRLQAS